MAVSIHARAAHICSRGRQEQDTHQLNKFVVLHTSALGASAQHSLVYLLITCADSADEGQRAAAFF